MHAYQTNILFLARAVGSQSKLALMLGNKMSQPTINNIIHGKRKLNFWEDKIFEQRWNIPEGWLRMPELIPMFWPFIVYINKCRSMGATYTDSDDFLKMEERLRQMPEYLNRIL